jgi:FKBP-type peptidyl-prolyl cis-trans isomerase
VPLSARSVALLALVSVLGTLACSRERSAPEALAPQEQERRDALYALGTWLARNLAGLHFEETDLAPLEEGLSDALLGRPIRVDPKEVGSTVQKLLNEKRAQVAGAEKLAAEPFLAAARAEPGAEKTRSGAIFRSLAAGEGASPALTDRVRLNYVGTRRDGSKFDSSAEHGGPEEFTVIKVIPCWNEALRRMKVGGKARVTCPSDLAYGDRGIGGKILPGAPLQFELELLAILPAKDAKP